MHKAVQENAARTRSNFSNSRTIFAQSHHKSVLKVYYIVAILNEGVICIKPLKTHQHDCPFVLIYSKNQMGNNPCLKFSSICIPVSYKHEQ